MTAPQFSPLEPAAADECSGSRAAYLVKSPCDRYIVSLRGLATRSV
jgi:hypothetical protein